MGVTSWSFFFLFGADGFIFEIVLRAIFNRLIFFAAERMDFFEWEKQVGLLMSRNFHNLEMFIVKLTAFKSETAEKWFGFGLFCTIFHYLSPS